MAFLAQGTSIQQRATSIWANIFTGELTMVHCLCQYQAKALYDEKGQKIQNEQRQVPGFENLTSLLKAMQRKIFLIKVNAEKQF
jgi:hypothetical protein